MISRRKLQVLLLVLLILLVSGIILRYLQKPSKAMRTLQTGSPYGQLIFIAGEADYITDGTVGVESDFKKSDDQLIRGCVKEVWYEHPLDFVPSKYSFCFDKDDKLIRKYHWSSW